MPLVLSTILCQVSTSAMSGSRAFSGRKGESSWAFVGRCTSGLGPCVSGVSFCLALRWQFRTNFSAAWTAPVKNCPSIEVLPVKLTYPPVVHEILSLSRPDIWYGMRPADRRLFVTILVLLGSRLLSRLCTLARSAHPSSSEAITSCSATCFAASATSASRRVCVVCPHISSLRQDCSTVLGNPNFAANTYS